MDHSIGLDQLAQAFRAGLAGPIHLDAALDLLLAATGGNAVGMWRRVGNDLLRLGFRCDSAFPADVAAEFIEVTRSVSLEKKGLGIVHATLTRQPAVALLSSQGGLLPGSAGWLERWGSVQSLSMPVLSGNEVVAVLALSTRFRFEATDRTWQLTDSLARQLASLLNGATGPESIPQ